MYRFWKCSQEKLHFTPVHALRQLKRDEALFPPFRTVVNFQRGTVRKLHTGLGGGPNLDSVQLTVEEKYLFTHFPTCPNLSGPVHITVTVYAPCTMSYFCTFKFSYSLVLRPIQLKLHILTRLIQSFPKVYGLWRCIEVKLSIPLGAHA